MRDLNMMDVKAVSGGLYYLDDQQESGAQQEFKESDGGGGGSFSLGDGSVTVSCCSIGIGPIGVEIDAFSLTATPGPSVDPFDAKLGINTGL